MKFRAWNEADEDPSLAWITKLPKELDRRDWKLATGVPSTGWFPAGVSLDLARNKGGTLADAVPNVFYLQIVSQKLRDLLAAESQARWEFLPVILRDRKRRPVDTSYFIANLLDVLPCVDMTASECELSKVISGEVEYFRRLVLDVAKIPAAARAFRMREQPRTILVREDLARSLEAAGCTGLELPAAEHIDELR
jgi:hypothetical protein